jgi:hypothetical protein
MRPLLLLLLSATMAVGRPAADDTAVAGFKEVQELSLEEELEDQLEELRIAEEEELEDVLEDLWIAEEEGKHHVPVSSAPTGPKVKPPMSSGPAGPAVKPPMSSGPAGPAVKPPMSSGPAVPAVKPPMSSGPAIRPPVSSGPPAGTPKEEDYNLEEELEDLLEDLWIAEEEGKQVRIIVRPGPRPPVRIHVGGRKR